MIAQADGAHTPEDDNHGQAVQLARPIHRVTAVFNTTTDRHRDCLEKIRHFLASRGVQLFETAVDWKACPVLPPDVQHPDLVIVIGGDGTFLRTARCFLHSQVPLVGVNTGHLGFLTRIEADTIELHLENLLAGKYRVQPRMLLAHTLDVADEALALNDIVVKNANPSQMARLSLFINNALVAVYDTDGMIFATPIGSTAYNLAAGGPVISPDIEAICITPICPHSFSAKPIVVPAHKRLRLESDARNRHPLLIAVDGQDVGSLPPGGVLEVTRSLHTLPMMKLGKDTDNFYRLLQKKLNWGYNPREHEGV
ncbi:MAG: NAD(+)/NADH kinase [Candidatus Melainabacteria bacterium]|nr:NAD(+)/NADH kinase [Candidatus Melainabacteria bacterium]